MGTAASNERQQSDQPDLPSAPVEPYPVSQPAAPPSSCPFLLAFAKDASAQFSLCPYISFTDLAALNVTCRSWRAWMLFPPAVACGSNGGGRHWARFTSTSLIELANCPWARGLLTELRANPERRSKEAQTSDAAWEAQRNKQTMSILRTLPRFPNLECLRLVPTFGEVLEPTVIIDVIRSTFRSLPRLSRLKLSLESNRGFNLKSQHAGLPLFMQCIDELRSLRELTIDGTTESVTSNVSFDRLLFCPALCRLEFTLTHQHGSEAADASPQMLQLGILAQCTQIESLSCKAWHVLISDPGSALRRFVETRLAAEESNRSKAYAGDASSSDKSLLPVRTLTHLDLRTTDLYVESILPLLAQFPALTDLSPRCWTTIQPVASGDELKPHWTHLASFKQLRILRLDARMDGAVQLSLNIILTQLGQSDTIQQLTLDSLVLSDAQLYAIVRQLKALHTLVLDCVRVDSLDPLSDAPALTSLRLRYCVLPPLPRVTSRSLVPRLPELLRLTILDTEYLRLTAAKAAPLRRTHSLSLSAVLCSDPVLSLSLSVFVHP